MADYKNLQEPRIYIVMNWLIFLKCCCFILCRVRYAQAVLGMCFNLLLKDNVYPLHCHWYIADTEFILLLDSLHWLKGTYS
jgi:hypothetical protein